ncbi:SphA family protein [Methylobacter svalbardensis]|uniref:SphA family protein n=1 Tax=Methylobacter svalbardensis TaxID=3080016 RepID=UPI0030EF5341
MTENNKFSLALRALTAATVLAMAAAFNGAHATEGASSHYVPGAYNDFFMNALQEPGLYFRDDLMYYGAQLPQTVTLGRNAVVGVDVDSWVNISKLFWVSDFEILGGRYGAGLFLPIVFDLNIAGSVQTGPFLRGRIPGQTFEGQDNRGGVGDMAAVPLSLTWKWQDVSVNLSQAVFMPSGYYDENEIVNLGRNHWSFDTLVGLTWLHPTRGHEISFNVGFMSNTENNATQYQSGDELHIDYTVAQHFSEAFGIGVTGYYYNQLTDDESPQLDRLQQVVNNVNALRQVLGREALPSVGGFRGEALGIGPIVRYSPKFGDKQVHFIGKWIHEFDVKNRLEGEIGMLSVALDF